MTNPVSENQGLDASPDGADFTPGPWHVSTVNGSIAAKIGRHSIFVADVWSCVGRPVGEASANARLIAAAPELYEALDELHLKAVVGTDDERHAALHKAWAALSRARGESDPR